MRLFNRLRRMSRTAVTNTLIAVAVLLVVLMTVRVMTADDTEEASAAQTAQVDVGEVTATVSASGNVEASTTVNLSFEGSGGIVEEIYVEEGEQVRKGQQLAVVDQTSARQTLDTALAGLRAARGNYTTVTQGQTAQEAAADQRTVEVSQESLDSALVSLSSARQTHELTRQQQDEAVASSERTLRTAEQERDQALQAHQADPSTESKEALDQARTDVETARSTLDMARNTRESSLLSARQQVAAQQSAVESARAQLAASQAQIEVNQQPAREGVVESALAQIDSAQVMVREARTALEDTALRAPTAGKVVAVNGVVGETSSSTTSTSTSTETTTTDTSVSATDTSGFITMSGVNLLEVTAYVAEADISDVQVGQPATVTLPATDREIEGTVTSVDAAETITNNVVEYGVTVRLSDAKRVKLGQTTQLVIMTGSKEAVLRAPSTALTTIGDRTTATVQSDDGTTSQVTVSTGLEGDGETEILSGLSEGDTLVLPEQASGSSELTFPSGRLGGGAGGLGGGGS